MWLCRKVSVARYQHTADASSPLLLIYKKLALPSGAQTDSLSGRGIRLLKSPIVSLPPECLRRRSLEELGRWLPRKNACCPKIRPKFRSPLKSKHSSTRL